MHHFLLSTFLRAAKQPIGEMTMFYTSSKAALNVYTKALSSELGLKGIRVNVASSCVVKTLLMLDFIGTNIFISNRTKLINGFYFKKLTSVSNLIYFLFYN